MADLKKTVLELISKPSNLIQDVEYRRDKRTYIETSILDLRRRPYIVAIDKIEDDKLQLRDLGILSDLFYLKKGDYITDDIRQNVDKFIEQFQSINVKWGALGPSFSMDIDPDEDFVEQLQQLLDVMIFFDASVGISDEKPV